MMELEDAIKHAEEKSGSCECGKEHAQLAKWLKELAALRAIPSSAPAGFKHDIGADRFTVVQGSYWWHVRAGEGTQNIGKFHTKRAAEEMALTLLTAFRDGAFMQYQAMLAAAPTPPSTEDRKDAEHVPLKPASAEDMAVYQQIVNNFNATMPEDKP